MRPHLGTEDRGRRKRVAEDGLRRTPEGVTRMPYAHPVKVVLAARGETQRHFATTVGVSAGTLSQVLNGNHVAWPALRRRIADELGVPEQDLFPEAGPVDRLLADRIDQGLPATVEDDVILRRIAALLARAQSSAAA